MKTKYFLLLIITLFFLAPTYGQRLKDKRVSIKYVSLPSQKLPDDYKTYSVSFRSSGGFGVQNHNRAESIKMDGFRRVSGTGSDFGHLRIYVEVGNVRTGKPQLKNYTKTNKDKDGKETKTTSYYYEIPYNVSSSYEIIDLDGKRLAFGNPGTSDTQSTGKHSSPSKALKALASLRGRMNSGIRGKAINNVVSATNRALAKNFDFHHSKISTELYIIKKHKTEKGFMQSFEAAKTVYESMSPTTPPAEAKERLASVLAFWSEQANIDHKKDKKLMRIFEAANYNLAVAYLYLDELDKAESHVQAITDLDGKNKKARKLLTKIDETRRLMDMHRINTLHYVRDLSDAVPPAQVAAYERQQQEEAKEAAAEKSIDATLTLKGEQIAGKVVVTGKETEELVFGQGGNLRFITEVDGKEKEHDLTAAEVSAFTLGNRLFEKRMFSPCAKGKTDAQLHILEEVYTSDKITLYQYYPSTGTLSGEKTELAYQKTGDPAPVSLEDTQFLVLNKGLSKYFADCPDLTKMCSEGQIELYKEDLIKAARIYTELCE